MGWSRMEWSRMGLGRVVWSREVMTETANILSRLAIFFLQGLYRQYESFILPFYIVLIDFQPYKRYIYA